MVSPIELMRALYRKHAFRVRNHAYQARFTAGVAADGAMVAIGEVLAYGAAADAALRLGYRVGERPGLSIRERNNEKSQPLRGFATNPRQSREFVD